MYVLPFIRTGEYELSNMCIALKAFVDVDRVLTAAGNLADSRGKAADVVRSLSSLISLPFNTGNNA